MVKVYQEVDTFVVGGADEGKAAKDPVVVRSHWIRDELVILRVEGSEVSVRAKDLQAAIKNATNTARW